MCVCMHIVKQVPVIAMMYPGFDPLALRPPYTAKVSGTCFWNSNTKQLGDLFQKQKIKGSLWNLCAVYAGLYKLSSHSCRSG